MHVLLRMAAGVPDDISWRVEQAAIDGPPARRTVTLTARTVGAALVLAISWVINIDATRRSSGSPFSVATSNSVPHTDKLPLLAAGVAATVRPSMLPQFAAQSVDAVRSGPTFEVASIKANKSGELRTTMAFQPGSRFIATNVSLGTLIRNAYQRSNFEIFGGPKWIESDRFDILAKAEGDPSPREMRLMLRALLAERYNVRVHNETRNLPLYELVVARRDRRNGPQLHRTNADCAHAPPPPPPPYSDGQPKCGFVGPTPGGYFDFELPMTTEIGPPPPPPGLPDAVDRQSLSVVSIFTAIQEQLGLKLESARGPAEVLVIDSAGLPTPD